MLESFSNKSGEVGHNLSDGGRTHFDPDRRLDAQERPAPFKEQRIDPDRRLDAQERPKEVSAAERRIDPDKRIEVQTERPREVSAAEGRIDPDKRIEVQTERPEIKGNAEIKELRMEPPIEIKFRCPEDLDRDEFLRQLKGQEKALNNMPIEKNMENRAAYREAGRTQEGNEAQRLAREKAEAERFSSNLDKGMSVKEARAEAKEWIKTQAAVHNPDQIAGGDPKDVSGVGDARVNSSIGAQWKSNVEKLDKEISEYASGLPKEKLAAIKLNVKLTLEV